MDHVTTSHTGGVSSVRNLPPRGIPSISCLSLAFLQISARPSCATQHTTRTLRSRFFWSPSASQSDNKAPLYNLARDGEAQHSIEGPAASTHAEAAALNLQPEQQLSALQPPDAQPSSPTNINSHPAEATSSDTADKVSLADWALVDTEDDWDGTQVKQSPGSSSKGLAFLLAVILGLSFAVYHVVKLMGGFVPTRPRSVTPSTAVGLTDTRRSSIPQNHDLNPHTAEHAAAASPVANTVSAPSDNLVQQARTTQNQTSHAALQPEESEQAMQSADEHTEELLPSNPLPETPPLNDAVTATSTSPLELESRSSVPFATSTPSSPVSAAQPLPAIVPQSASQSPLVGKVQPSTVPTQLDMPLQPPVSPAAPSAASHTIIQPHMVTSPTSSTNPPSALPSANQSQLGSWTSSTAASARSPSPTQKGMVHTQLPAATPPLSPSTTHKNNAQAQAEASPLAQATNEPSTEAWPPLPAVPNIKIPSIKPEPISRAPDSSALQHLRRGTSAEALRQRTQLALRAAASAAEASQRAAAYAAAASTAASKAAEAAERAAAAATAAQVGMETAADTAVAAAEARMQQAAQAVEDAEKRAAQAAALSTAYQDVSQRQAEIAEEAAGLRRPEPEGPLQSLQRFWRSALNSTNTGNTDSLPARMSSSIKNFWSWFTKPF